MSSSKGLPPQSRPRAASRSSVKPRLSFVKSAAELRGCPQDERPEVALVGRSNAGKSTLINGIAGSRIAQVSGTPGKTRLLNFFNVGEAYRIVDMPGYGYAARSGGEQADWRGMIEPYLSSRGNLKGLLLIMDSRRDWSADEQMLVDWIAPRELPVALVLTKADKLSRGEAIQRRKSIQAQSGLEHVFLTSSLKKEGFTAVEDFLFNEWVKPTVKQT